jgi:hypothetical protein
VVLVPRAQTSGDMFVLIKTSPLLYLLAELSQSIQASPFAIKRAQGLSFVPYRP